MQWLILNLLNYLGFRTNLKDYVWYLGYGSNILSNRFICYITGGQTIGNLRQYQGCRDKSKPLRRKKIIINHELYFSKESQAWENGGVAFIGTTSNREVITYARMYLITKQQLCDVAKQETNSNALCNINFDEAVNQGETVFKNRSWYGKVLYLGQNNGLPIFALTNENNLTVTTKPSSHYLRTIGHGLKKVHGISEAEIVNYFLDKRGVTGNYMEAELLKILSD